MITGWKHSSESKRCVVCRHMTSHYKIYKESGIEIVVPLCDAHFDSTEASATARLSILRAIAELLGYAKSDIPDLLEEVERLRVQHEELTEGISRLLAFTRYIPLSTDEFESQEPSEEKELALIDKIFDIQKMARELRSKALEGVSDNA